MTICDLCMYDPSTLKVSRAQWVRLQRRRMPLKGPKGSKPGPKRAEKHHIQFQHLEFKKRPCIEEPPFSLRVPKNAHSRRSRFLNSDITSEQLCCHEIAVGLKQEPQNQFANPQLSTVRRFAMVENLSVGMRLHAMYGRALYASEVVFVSTSAKRKKKPATWIK